MVLFLVNNHNVISYHNNLFDLSKTLVKLEPETYLLATVTQKGITFYLKLPGSVLNEVKNDEASSSC